MGATWAFELLDRLSGPSRAAASALDRLEGELRSAESALTRLNRAQRDLKLQQLSGLDLTPQMRAASQATGRQLALQRLQLQVQREAVQEQLKAARGATKLTDAQAFVRALSPLRAYQSGVERLRESLHKAAKDGGLFTRALGGAWSALRSVSTVAGVAIGGVLGLGAAFVRFGIEASTNAQSARAALASIMGPEAGGRVFTTIQRMGRVFGTETGEMVEQFRSLHNAGMDTAGAFQLMQRALDLGGGERAAGIMLAVTQIMSKGKLMAQEMNQLAERGVGRNQIYEALARRMGKTVDQVKAMAESHAGIRDMPTVVGAINDAIAQMTGSSRAGEAALARMANSPLGRFQRLKQSIMQLFENADSTAFRPLLRVMDKLEKLFDPATESGRRFQADVNRILTDLFKPLEGQDPAAVFQSIVDTAKKIPDVLRDALAIIRLMSAAATPLIKMLDAWNYMHERRTAEAATGPGGAVVPLTAAQERANQARPMSWTERLGRVERWLFDDTGARHRRAVISRNILGIGAGTELGHQLIAGLNRGMEIHSPSRATERMGRHLIEGLDRGMAPASSRLAPSEARDFGGAGGGGRGGGNVTVNVTVDGSGAHGDPQELAAILREELTRLLTSLVSSQGAPA